uniref:5,6-dimethylbenzimidazole synthase n=1 Tax=uncultured Sphingomonas sp. TaxID=158754 RepID=UPI0035CC95C9
MTSDPAPPPLFDPAFRDSLAHLFRWRRDVRHFRGDPVPDALLEDLLATASLAPSVGLSQPWHFVTVDDATRRARVRDAFITANRSALAAQAPDRADLYARLKLAGLDEAPCHLTIFVEDDPAQGHGLGRRTMPETVVFSAVMAVHTLWLAARATGLGLGWVSILDPDAVRDILDVPPAWRLIGYLCLGYPAEENDTPELERAGWEQRRPAERLRR